MLNLAFYAAFVLLFVVFPLFFHHHLLFPCWLIPSGLSWIAGLVWVALFLDKSMRDDTQGSTGNGRTP